MSRSPSLSQSTTRCWSRGSTGRVWNAYSVFAHQNQCTGTVSRLLQQISVAASMKMPNTKGLHTTLIINLLIIITLFATLPEQLRSLLFCPKTASFQATPEPLVISTNACPTHLATNSSLELSIGGSLQHKVPWMTDTTRDSACLTPPTVSCQR